MLRQAKSVLRYLFNRSQFESELDAELSYHLERQTELNVSRGLSPTEAQRQARLSLGIVEPLKEQCREARKARNLEITMQDIRYGIRSLLRSPGFAIMCVLTMALGIGANTAIFSLVYGVLLRPLPYQNGSRLVVLHQRAARTQADADVPFSVSEIKDYRERSKTLDSVVEHHTMVFLLLGQNTAERVDTAVVSANFFDVLGVKPLMGRTFVASDDTLNSNAVLVLSNKYWKSNLGGDPDVIGKVFQMNNRAHTVIGVLPPIPQYPVESDVYMPTSQCPTRSSPGSIANRRARMMTAFGRMKPESTVEQTRAELAGVAGQIAGGHADVYPAATGYTLRTEALRDDLTRKARTTFFILLGTAGLVLLLACANVGNLLLARAMRMERDMAVRAALGASRGRLLRHNLTESLIISLAGGVVGILLAPLALGLLSRFAEQFTTRAAEVRLDAPVLLFAVGISIVTGLLFGLIPALSRGEVPATALAQGATRSATSRSAPRIRAALVVAQVALCFVLLIGAGLMIRSFQRLQKVSPGFQTDRLLSLRMSTSFTKYNTAASRYQLVEKVNLALRNLPGVQAAAIASNVPFSPNGIANGPFTAPLLVEGQEAGGAQPAPRVDTVFVSEGYFEAVKQPLTVGRTFTARDDQDAPQVAIVNQTMARRRWPGQSAIGKRISFNQGTQWVEVVGVVGDTREYGLERPPNEEVYRALPQGGFGGNVVVRTAAAPETMIPAVRAAIRAIDTTVAIDSEKPVERLQYESQGSPRVTAILLGMFGVLATIVCACGIGAVMALSVSQRSQELGIRMALGASRSGVIGLVVREGVALAVIGTIVGVAAAVALSRVMATLLFATSPTDLATFVAVSLIFLAVAGFAAFVPARRVTAIDPLSALRQD